MKTSVTRSSSMMATMVSWPFEETIISLFMVETPAEDSDPPDPRRTFDGSGPAPRKTWRGEGGRGRGIATRACAHQRVRAARAWSAPAAEGRRDPRGERRHEREQNARSRGSA